MKQFEGSYTRGTRAEQHVRNPRETQTGGTRAKRRCTEPARMMSRDHTLKPKKTNVRVSGTYGEMFTIPLVFHVLAYVPQCTSSMHLLFGVYGGVILAMVASRSCRLTSDKEGSGSNFAACRCYVSLSPRLPSYKE